MKMLDKLLAKRIQLHRAQAIGSLNKSLSSKSPTPANEDVQSNVRTGSSALNSPSTSVSGSEGSPVRGGKVKEYLKNSKRRLEEIESDSESTAAEDQNEVEEESDDLKYIAKRRRLEKVNDVMDVESDVESDSRSAAASEDSQRSDLKEQLSSTLTHEEDYDKRIDDEIGGEKSVVGVGLSGWDAGEGGTSGDEEKEPAKTKPKPRAYHVIFNELKAMIAKTTEAVMTQSMHEEVLSIVKELEEVYRVASKSKASENIRIRHPRTERQFLRQLQGNEELKRPWMPKNRYPNGKYPSLGPLVRAWDERSKAKINNSKIGMLSGGSGWRDEGALNTYSGRKAAIHAHSRWRNRKLTPFISTTSSCKEVFNLRMPHFDKRQHKSRIEPNTRLTLLNPNVLLELGLPLLKMLEELKRYKVHNEFGGPTNFSYGIYDNEYLLLWNACPRVIVCTWTKAEIDGQMKTNGWGHEKWWQLELMVKFEAHEKTRREGKLKDCPKEGCSCCGHK